MAQVDICSQLKALGDPTRFQIVQLLRQRQHCPRSIALTLGITESAVSQQMTVLRSVGLVESYRHSYHIHFRLVASRFERLAGVFAGWADMAESSLDCHDAGACQYRLDDGSSGCLYECAGAR